MIDQALDARISVAAQSLHRARRIVAFTGAGVSTESGIPDFRSPGGVWTRYQPVMYDDFVRSEQARRQYWAMRRELYPVIAAARPNGAHLALARLEQIGRLDAVITQNIDGLHQLAGNTEDRVIELHGTNRYAVCLGCQEEYPMASIQVLLEAGEAVPTCNGCGGAIKAATVSFGQQMPKREMEEAIRRACACDAMICIGSSLIVYPAADLPALAKRAGALLIIVNRDPTGLDDWADHVLRGQAGEILPLLVERTALS